MCNKSLMARLATEIKFSIFAFELNKNAVSEGVRKVYYNVGVCFDAM